MNCPSSDPKFPCSLTISIPLPTSRLAKAALRSLNVDPELSSLVRRKFSLIEPQSKEESDPSSEQAQEPPTILLVEYSASTNRMLRVAVNGFMESLNLIIGVMEELDGDVLALSSSSG